ncbi:hypothetical protein JCM10908_006683 [Rhodotorula pacifica]|uniref:uncharacterized protein n=1 Tax=Rhodotorula pacifica TaxID=1495444 RepID=UPI0031768757
MPASYAERDHDTDESTPLLARRASGHSSHPTGSAQPRPRKKAAPRLTASAPYASTSTSQLHPLARTSRALAALKAGHLPSSSQLLSLSRLALQSDALRAEPSGAVWQPTYGHGRLGVGKLTAKGERVRLALRRAIEKGAELVEQRNPSLKYRHVERVWVAKKEGGGDGDGWQEFVWAYRQSSIRIKPPLPSPPSTDPPTSTEADPPSTTFRTSLLTLVHLLLTSSSLHQLLSDLALLLRDLLHLQLSRRKEEGKFNAATEEKVGRVVDTAVERVAGEEAVREHDAEVTQKQGNDEGDDAALRPDQGVEGNRDKIMDRLREVVLELQRSSAYQHAMQDLLAHLRAYLRETVDSLRPNLEIEVEAAASSSSFAPPTGAPLPADPLEMILPLLEPFTKNGPGSLSSLPARSHLLFASPSPPFPPTSSPFTTPDDVPLVLPPQEHLSHLLSDLDSFLSAALLQPGWVGSSASYRSLGVLQLRLSEMEQDAPIWIGQVRSLLSDLLTALGEVCTDPFLREAMLAMEELGGAIGAYGVGVGEVLSATAAGGLGGFGAEVCGDLVEWIWPRVMGVLAEVPLPRLEFATPKMALALEPPSLISTSFIPGRITFHQSSTLSYTPATGRSTLALPVSASHPAPPAPDPSSTTTYESVNTLSVEGIQLEVLNVGYFASYKTGIPCFGEITEAGLLDLRLGVEDEDGDDSARRSDGLAFDLTFTVPSQPSATSSGIDSSPAPPLFKMDHSRTLVRLHSFHLEPHQSSHPWLMWFFRPLLRKAVQSVVEKEVKEKVLEKRAEWIAQKGGEVRRRKREREREQEREREMGTERAREEGVTGRWWSREAVWNWIRAGWDVLVAGEPAANEEEDDAQTVSSPPTPTADDPPKKPHVHLNEHGIAADLDNLEATVGLGSEGVVIPIGEAEIPLPEGQAPKKGLIPAARDEVAHEVQEGREVAKAALGAVGEVVEAREEWRAPRQGALRTWRSAAFDV